MAQFRVYTDDQMESPYNEFDPIEAKDLGEAIQIVDDLIPRDENVHIIPTDDNRYIKRVNGEWRFEQ